MADAVRQRRAVVARWVKVGKRVGYALWALAVALVVTGIAVDLPRAMLTAATACLISGAVVLAPAIVLGYAVNAAERDDKARGL